MSVGSVNGDVPSFMFIKPGGGKSVAGKLAAGAEAARHSVAQPQKAAGLSPDVAEKILGSAPNTSTPVSPDAVLAQVDAKRVDIRA